MQDERFPRGQRVILWQDTLSSRDGWPAEPGDGLSEGAWPWITANHRFNALLWDQEDLARRRQAPDADIVANKRAIDAHNQARNDAIERIDETLIALLGWPDGRSPASGARLNSETPGSMIDRLSILGLKCRAMAAQTVRDDVDDAHREASRAKLARLREQREDLARCLDELLRDAAQGRAAFKIYRQFKMYNDPRLNPALVAEQARVAQPSPGDGERAGTSRP